MRFSKLAVASQNKRDRQMEVSCEHRENTAVDQGTFRASRKIPETDGEWTLKGSRPGQFPCAAAAHKFPATAPSYDGRQNAGGNVFWFSPCCIAGK
ncbi:hypothetical protein RRG08_049414 [Elysia crispata]|uniref:Uncharacterized protein n=1 Tax=Elysia crispata TaxID=231223 RepID=A0AAE1DM51_9GAST|nr:hypothetical protein RRG08_049414 [Elysia crispata]